MLKLNQFLAIKKEKTSRACSSISELHKISQKSDVFNGFIKTYEKKDEDGEDFPAEKKKVTASVTTSMEIFAAALTDLIDINATVDYANLFAVADIVVNGVTIASNAPATFILAMEKQVNDIRTFINTLPVLDESEDWTLDENSGLYKSGSIKTHKTKKIVRPLTLAEATKEHPAQAQLISEDVIIGYWNTIKHSGAIPLPIKNMILNRVEQLSSAIKIAREEANSVECDNVHVGNKLFKYLFS